MGQAVSTSALWGASQLLGSSAELANFEAIIDSAFMPGGLGPMLMSPISPSVSMSCVRTFIYPY